MLYQLSSTKSRTGLIYHNAKKHSAPKIVVTLKAPNNDHMYLFGYPAFQVERRQKLEVEISKKNFVLVKKNMDGITSNQFQGVAMNYIAISKDWLKLIFSIWFSSKD